MLTQNWKAIILEKQGRGLKTAEKSPRMYWKSREDIEIVRFGSRV